jgi:hypothetical protein
MKTFQQFNEEAQVGPSTRGDSSQFQSDQLQGFSNKLDSVRKAPVKLVKDLYNAKKEAEQEKENEQRKIDIYNKKMQDSKKIAKLEKQIDNITKKDQQQTTDKKPTPTQQTNEVYDPEVQGRSQIRKTGEGGRVGRDRRKSEPERRRMKATGGGKFEPVSYKDRKDIGSQRQASTREKQPTVRDPKGREKVKQSYADDVKAKRKAAALARRQANSGGGEVKKTTTSSKDLEKQASKLLTKKTPEKKVDPSYKPAKASGMTRAERMKVTRKGETMLRGIFKGQETDRYKKETGQNPDAKGRTKIMGRVHARMK